MLWKGAASCLGPVAGSCAEVENWLFALGIDLEIINAPTADVGRTTLRRGGILTGMGSIDRLNLPPHLRRRRRDIPLCAPEPFSLKGIRSRSLDCIPVATWWRHRLKAQSRLARKAIISLIYLRKMERAKRFELSTPTLATSTSDFSRLSENTLFYDLSSNTSYLIFSCISSCWMPLGVAWRQYGDKALLAKFCLQREKHDADQQAHQARC